MVRNEVSTAGLDHTIVVTESDLETSSERSPLLGPVSIKLMDGWVTFPLYIIFNSISVMSKP